MFFAYAPQKCRRKKLPRLLQRRSRVRHQHVAPAADDAADKAIERIKAGLQERYPGYRYAVFLDIGLPAEWRRQAQAAKPAAATQR